MNIHIAEGGGGRDSCSVGVEQNSEFVQEHIVRHVEIHSRTLCGGGGGYGGQQETQKKCSWRKSCSGDCD